MCCGFHHVPPLRSARPPINMIVIPAFKKPPVLASLVALFPFPAKFSISFALSASRITAITNYSSHSPFFIFLVTLSTTWR